MSGGPNMARISSMQQYSEGGASGGAGMNELSFGVDPNILQALTGDDPKGGSLVSILTGGITSISGIAFDFGFCSATQSMSSLFNLPTGPNIGLPNLTFGLTKAGGKGGGH
jgi:hypothetical protein